MAENSNPESPAPTLLAKPPSIDFVGAFKFLFSNANALNNLLIGAVMNLIPIIGPIVLMGWHCEIIQRLVKRHEKPIPKLDFSDFLYFLGRGLAPFVVALIATLPLTLLIMVLMFGGMFGVALLESAFHREGGAPGPLIAGGMGIGALLFLLLILFFNVIVSAALVRAELTEDIGKSLDLGKIWAFAKETWKDFLVAYIVFIPVAMIVMFAGMLVVFVGIYAAIILINISYVHLRWQVYERYLIRGGKAIPIQTKSGPLPSEARLAAKPA
ncbi:MAG: DUF4013 domain-containing protein [bacterium]